jgi:hypothetical protein
MSKALLRSLTRPTRLGLFRITTAKLQASLMRLMAGDLRRIRMTLYSV